jgi:outer membrane protein TolC
MISIIALAVASASPTTVAASAIQPNLSHQGSPMQLSMEEAVEIGTERSFRLQRSMRNERMSEQRVKGTKASLGPRVDVGLGADQSQRHYDFQGTYDYNRGQPAFYADGHANASYEIDISGVKKRQLEQSRLSHEMSGVDLAQTTLDVSSDIRTQYVQALRAQEQVTVDEEYLRSIDSLLDRARLGQPSVVAFLETERSNARQSLESTKQNADLAFSTLRQTLRLKNDQPLELTSKLNNPVPLPSTDKLLQLAYQNRNDLKQAQLRLKQARLQKLQASDSRKPSLRASANAGQSFNGDYITLGGDNHGRTRQAAAMLNFALPLFLFDGGQLRSQQNVANIQADQAVADADEAKERAENEINQTMIGLNRAQQRLKSLPDATQARQSLSQAEQQMLAASATEAAGILAQVTNARQNWRSSVLSRNDALTEFYQNFYRLQRSLGTEDIGPQYIAMAN